MENPRKICAAYIRVSTHDQEEYSPDSQLRLIRDYAKSNGYVLPDEYIFKDDGISGRTAQKRPGFMSMIAAAKEKPRPFETILVWKFSRFARNQEESVVYKSLLKKENGIDVISISEPLMEGPFGGLIERIIEWFDAFYSANLGAEVRRGMTERASRGLPVSVAPLGYTYQNKAFVVIPREADTVRAIYRDFLGGVTMISIAKKLNMQGVRTKRGGPWENRTVRYILTNPVYTGKVRWCRDGVNDYHGSALLDGTMIVEGEHEAIISQEEFDAVQRRIEDYQRRYKGSAPKAQRQEVSRMLQGIVKCSACGGTLSFTGAGMNCVQYVHGKCRVSHYITVKKLEELVLSSIEEQLDSLKLNIISRQSPDREAERQRLEQLLRREESILQRYRESYAAGVDTLEEYRANKAASEARTLELQKSLAGLQKPAKADPDAFAKKHRNAIQALKNAQLTAQEKNALLRGFVDHVVFFKDTKRVEVVYYV